MTERRCGDRNSAADLTQLRPVISPSACGEATDELGDENQNQPADRVTFEVAMRSTVLRL